jgi:hypothetical protein
MGGTLAYRAPGDSTGVHDPPEESRDALECGLGRFGVAIPPGCFAIVASSLHRLRRFAAPAEPRGSLVSASQRPDWPSLLSAACGR